MRARIWKAVGFTLVLGLALPLGFWQTLAEDYICTTNNDTITMTRCTGSGGDVSIPSIINGLPVTSIGSCAFWECSNLASVTDAFAGFTNLNRVA